MLKVEIIEGSKKVKISIYKKKIKVEKELPFQKDIEELFTKSSIVSILS